MPTHRLTDDDVAAIRKATEGYAAAALAGDWGARIGCFAEDAVFMPPGSPALQGLTPRYAHSSRTFRGCQDSRQRRSRSTVVRTSRSPEDSMPSLLRPKPVR